MSGNGGFQQRSRRVRSLLWNEISALLNPGERDVVRKSIGADVIERNEVLFREAVAYEEILQFVDEDMQRQIASHKILDTPARQMLEKEIRMLVQHIQGCSATDDDPPGGETDDSRTEGSLGPCPKGSSSVSQKGSKDPLSLNGKCKNTLDYVMSKNAIQEKQKSGNPSQFPPCISGIYHTGEASVPTLRKIAVDPSLIVRKIAPHLNVAGIESVTDRLRHAFSAEHEALMEDVESLRTYLEDSTDVYSSVKNNPPTINEMKDCGKKLEETWAALRHCQNIQSILAPVDRTQCGGANAPTSHRNSETQVEVTPGEAQPGLKHFPACKRSIRLPKVEKS